MTDPIKGFRVTVADTPEHVQQMVSALSSAGSFAFDTETRSTDFEEDEGGALRKMSMEVDIASFAIEAQEAWVVPIGMVTLQSVAAKDFMEIVRPLMENTTVLKKAWNYSYDAALYANYDVWVTNYIDVMVKAHCVDEHKGAGLKARCTDGGMTLTPYNFKEYWKARQAYLSKATNKKGETVCTYQTLRDMEEVYIRYAAEDSIAAVVLDPIYDIELDKLPKIKELFHRLLNPAVRCIFNMERRGVPINRVYLNTVAHTCALDRDIAEAKVYALAGQHFNIGSTKELGRVLYQEMGLPVLKHTEKGANSTDSDTLKKLAMDGHSITTSILAYRRLEKLHGSFLSPSKGLQRLCYPWGAIHPSLNICGTDTGRLSCSQPNLQQTPRSSARTYEIRKSFIPHKGYTLVGGDMSQVELRMMAHMSGDANMCAEYCKDALLWKIINEGGDVRQVPKSDRSDIHQATADACQSTRNTAKCVSGRTLLQRPDGTLVSIEAVGEFGEVDSFKDLGVDICNGTTTVKALQTFNGGEKMLYKVLTRRGGILCTKQHKIALTNGRVVTVGSIKKGDVVKEAVVIPLPQRQERFMPRVTFRPRESCPLVEFKTSYALAYFAGLYTGDGCKLSDHSVAISHGATTKTDELGTPYAQWQDIIVKAAEDAGFPATRRELSVYLGSRSSMRLMIALGLIDEEQGHRSLDVPDWVLSDATAFKHFVAGLFDTDGTVAPTGQASFTSKDFILATRVAVALRALGAEVYIEPTWNPTYERWYYRTHIAVRHCHEVLTYMRHPGKVARLKPASQCRAGRAQKPNIVTLIVEAGVAPCYDLYVDSPDHLYSANGLVTHNSINFGMIYGMQSKALANLLTTVNFDNCLEKGVLFDTLSDVVTLQLAQEFIDRFFNKYSRVLDYQKHIGDKVLRQGYIETRFGRRRRFPDVYSGDRWLVMGAQRQAVNMTIQGSVAEMILLMMCRADNIIESEDGAALKKLGYRQMLQNHDEILGECPEDRQTVQDVKYHLSRIFQNPGPSSEAYPFSTYKVPLVFEAHSGPTWHDVH